MKTGLQQNGTMLVQFSPRVGDILAGKFTLINGTPNAPVEFASILELFALIDQSVAEQDDSCSEWCGDPS